jgi:flagellar basal body rod protein FlgG
MNRGIYSAATGMAAMRRQLDVTANNLANVSTTGFKRDELSFNDVFGKELNNGIGSLGYGPTSFSEFTAFNDVGDMKPTGNPLDLAIETPGAAFAIRSAEGTIAYTRDGSFGRDQDGYLVTRSGERVLDENQSDIALPEGLISVSPDGTLMHGSEEVAKVGVFSGRFTKVGGNRFQGAATLAEDAHVRSGYLEGSNVNAIEAMTAMISINRSFEIAQKSISAQDELAQKLIQSLDGR